MNTVKCRTLYNQTKEVPAESLIQRPSVYGLVLYERTILLAEAKHTGKYVLPGGGIHKGEEIHAALRREIKEETGIEIEVGRFLHFETDFFYYDPLDVAIHGFLFFYLCQPLTLETTTPLQIEGESEEGLLTARWVNIDDLSRDSFQTHGHITMQLIHANIGT